MLKVFTEEKQFSLKISQADKGTSSTVCENSIYFWYH